MKTITLPELKDSKLLKESGPILVTQEGRPLGYFTPLSWPDESIPLEERRRLFKKASEKIRRELDRKGITEEQVDRDIATLFEDNRR